MPWNRNDKRRTQPENTLGIKMRKNWNVQRLYLSVHDALFLKGICPSANMTDVNTVMSKTSNIKHAYMHLSSIVIGSAWALGMVCIEGSGPYFTA